MSIGAVFAFKEGGGYVVKLHFLPLDGRMILVPQFRKGTANINSRRHYDCGLFLCGSLR